nr:hypothetical protein [Tanacetum cinerariifolium]
MVMYQSDFSNAREKRNDSCFKVDSYGQVGSSRLRIMFLNAGTGLDDFGAVSGAFYPLPADFGDGAALGEALGAVSGAVYGAALVSFCLVKLIGNTILLKLIGNLVPKELMDGPRLVQVRSPAEEKKEKEKKAFLSNSEQRSGVRKKEED